MSDQCTPQTCDARESIIGYAPNLTASAIFAGIFGISCLLHTFQGIKYKSWSFMACMAIGCALESVGYGGRIMLSKNPFSDPGFKLQVVLLTFSPAFYSAAIYLMLKHLILTFGTTVSRLRPSWYTYIFISCDVFSIVLQGTGGGLASAATAPGPLLTAGKNVMIAGLAFQVFTMVAFGILAAEYFIRLRLTPNSINEVTTGLRQSRRFHGFLAALVLAYLCILVRCTYRVAEMCQGWGSAIMADETAFNICDPAMCIIATLAFNAFHPGLCFQGIISNPKLAEKDMKNVSPSDENLA